MRTLQAIRTVVGVVAFAFILLGQVVSQGWGMAARPPVVGLPAPEFQLPDLEGHVRHLSQYRGRIVLLNFWATWCKPCTTEMPAMQAAHERLRPQGLVVLAINELEDVTKVREHISAHGHTFPVLLDQDNRVANLYGVVGLPVSVFVDEDGRVQEYIRGGLLTEQKIREVMDRLRARPDGRTTALR